MLGFCNSPLSGMTNVRDADNLFIVINAKDNSMRFEHELAKRVLEVLVLSRQSETLGMCSNVSIFL